MGNSNINTKEKGHEVLIDEISWAKMAGYAKAAAPDEVIGLAHCKVVGGKIVVSDPLIMKQTVSSAECEVEPAEFAKFIGEHQRIAEVLCVWHSHVNMSAFFSSCDRGTSNALAQLGSMMQGNSSWFVSIVLNLKGEYECKVDVYKPIKLTLNASLEVTKSKDFPEPTKEEMEEFFKSDEVKREIYLSKLDKALKDEVKEKCSKGKHSSANGYGYGMSTRGSEWSDYMKTDDTRDIYTYDDLFKYLAIEG